MDTLPRFRLPDESSSHDVSSVIATSRLQALEFDDLDEMATRVVDRDGRRALPAKRPAKSGLEDVVEDLRAAAAGRSSKVRELTSDDLLDEIPDADDAQVVDISELVFDRVAARNEALWNVRQASHLGRASILGPNPIRTRFIVTAALAMALGALLAVVVAIAIWRLSGLSI